MQKLQRVAQGAALSKVILVSIVVKWWCAAPRLAFLWRRGGLVSGTAATRARVRPWPVGLLAVTVTGARLKFARHSAYAAVVLR